MNFDEWSNEELLRQFEALGYEYYEYIETLGQECIRRTGVHPNKWRHEGVVHTSWTHEDLTHNPFNRRCPVVRAGHMFVVSNKMQDAVPKEFTCLWCLGTGSGAGAGAGPRVGEVVRDA